MTALIAALGMVPMAKAVGGFLIAPIVSGLLGILVWREPPTAPRLARLGGQLRRRGACCCAPRPASSPARSSRCSAARCSATYLAATRGARDARPTRSRRWPCSRCSAPALLAPFALAGGLPALTPGARSPARWRSAASRRSATS